MSRKGPAEAITSLAIEFTASLGPSEIGSKSGFGYPSKVTQNPPWRVLQKRRRCFALLGLFYGRPLLQKWDGTFSGDFVQAGKSKSVGEIRCFFRGFESGMLPFLEACHDV